MLAHRCTQIYTYIHTSTDVEQWPKGWDHINKQSRAKAHGKAWRDNRVISAWQHREERKGREKEGHKVEKNKKPFKGLCFAVMVNKYKQTQYWSYVDWYIQCEQVYRNNFVITDEIITFQVMCCWIKTQLQKMSKLSSDKNSNVH